MLVANEVIPQDPEVMKKLREPGPNGPIVMVNLLKFKEKAHYRDGRDAQISGREAYMRYATGVDELIKEYGGRVLFVGDVTFLMLGSVVKVHP